jgi:N-acetylmuramoyl-L-alanine amidase
MRLSRGIFAATSAGAWRGWRTAIALIPALALLSIGHAGWSRQNAKVAPSLGAAPKPHASQVALKCDPPKFRIILDVGHTRESEGATSARNIPEFNFNLELAKRIEEKLRSEGFVQTRLLVTGGKARPSLFTRVAAANSTKADFFLSIHHDSVPDSMLEKWDFEGTKSFFSDRFTGYGVFVSRRNTDFADSMAFARLVGLQMRAEGLPFAEQYTQPIMGRYRHPLLDKDAGVYGYDDLVVLMKAAMPAVLLEAGSIINRDEELQLSSMERQDIIGMAVSTAMKEFCDAHRSP